ncbi:MAG: hypothetical protein EPN84_00470 [Legionella sp.]|nr:MAG: hypothetical protein EPN84_00470 [Legionella sp.]
MITLKKLLIPSLCLSLLPFSLLWADNNYDDHYCRDGKPRDTVCQKLQDTIPGLSRDKTKKLYGLCQNYCVQQNCDLPKPKGNKKECMKLLDKWTALANGMVIPCNASPAISLTKDVVYAQDNQVVSGTDVVQAGTRIKYTFTVQNIGNVPLTSLSVVDTTLNTLYGTTLNCTLPTSLAVGANATCTSEEVNSIDNDTHNVVNTATASGKPPTIYNLPQVTSVDSATYMSSASNIVCPCHDGWTQYFSTHTYPYDVCQGTSINDISAVWNINGDVGHASITTDGAGTTCVLVNNGMTIVNPGVLLNNDEINACFTDLINYCSPGH